MTTLEVILLAVLAAAAVYIWILHIVVRSQKAVEKYWERMARQERESRYAIASELNEEKSTVITQLRKIKHLIPALEFYADYQEPGSNESNFHQGIGPRGKKLGIMEKGALRANDVHKIGTYADRVLGQVNDMNPKTRDPYSYTYVAGSGGSAGGRNVGSNPALAAPYGKSNAK